MFSTRNLKVDKWSKEKLLEYVTEEQVFAKLGLPVEEPIGTRFCSPFRRDSTPDCKLLLTGSGKLRFYDPAGGLNLDWIGLVMYVQNIPYGEAIEEIANLFGLTGKTTLPPPVAVPTVRKPPLPTTIQVRTCPLSNRDKQWWAQFNVDEAMLFRNRVWAISDYWLNGNHHYCPKGQLAFCYKEDDGYKLYFPEEEKRWKWRSTTKALACYEQLPQTGELLVITSSKKDALCLMSFGYHPVAPQGEGVDIHSYTLWELKQRFKKVVLFYDNDYPGLQLAHQKKNLWQIDDFVFLPFNEEAKDPAAYCQLHGAELARTQFSNLLSPC